eukprot:925187-Pelagomonas_calceolata.AAC.5
MPSNETWVVVSISQVDATAAFQSGSCRTGAAGLEEGLMSSSTCFGTYRHLHTFPTQGTQLCICCSHSKLHEVDAQHEMMLDADHAKGSAFTTSRNMEKRCMQHQL